MYFFHMFFIRFVNVYTIKVEKDIMFKLWRNLAIFLTDLDLTLEENIFHREVQLKQYWYRL